MQYLKFFDDVKAVAPEIFDEGGIMNRQVRGKKRLNINYNAIICITVISKRRLQN